MHILLTDRLACPRCGPEFGLILLADRVEDRRVVDGALGCPNCRDRFPIEDTVADLRPPPRAPEAAIPRESEATSEEVMRLGALLGITDGPGMICLLGLSRRFGPYLTELLPSIEVLEAGSTRLIPDVPADRSAVIVADLIPVFSSTFRGVVVEAGDEALAREAWRVTVPGGRVVALPKGPSAAEFLLQCGGEVLLNEGGFVVVRR